MKEPVLDIALVLKSINGKIDELTHQLNAANKRIEFLERENAWLKARLAIYETPKDSHNSSIPPSKDSIAAQTEKAKKLQATRSLREKTNKKNGEFHWRFLYYSTLERSIRFSENSWNYEIRWADISKWFT